MDIRLYAVAASLLLSVFVFFLPDIPNDDSYTYIKTAEIYLEQGVGAAIANYTWAGYPILIALVSKLGISLFTAAYIVNGLFHALLVYSFISIIKLLDDSKEIVWLGALTVLVFPELNEYREMVIRDIAFWGLSLCGLWQFMLFFEDRRFKHGLFFCLAIGAALVFRIEAVAYLALTPLCLLFDSRRQASENRRDTLRLLGLVLAFGIVTALLLLVAGVNIFALMLEFVSVYQPFLLNAINPSEAQVAAMGNAIFGDYASIFSRQYVTAVVAFGLLVVLFVSVFYAISGPYFWLLVYGWFRKYLALDNRKLIPVFCFLLVNAVILLGFLYITRYLEARYAIILALMVSVQVPFVTKHIIDSIHGTSSQLFGTYFLVLFFFFCAIDGYVSFGEYRDWLLDAADYVSENANPNAAVISNNHTIAYFSGEVDAYDRVVRNLTENEILDASPGDLIAVELFYEMTLFVEDPAINPYLEQIAVFPVDEEPRAAIYRRVNPPE